jgi:phage terminase large subunit-like protein
MYAVTDAISPAERREEQKLPADERRERVEARTRYYVVDVVRKQVQAKQFALALRAMYTEQRGPMLWIGTGIEKAVAEFMQDRLPLRVRNASEDKYQRALPVSTAWNDSRVFLPRGEKTFDEDGEEKWIPPEWLDTLLEEVSSFTGSGDATDDIVDALAAGHEALEHVPVDTGDIPPPVDHIPATRGGW